MEETKQSYYLVLGLGSSGLSMARFLHGRGKKVVATDIDGSKSQAEKVLNELGIKTQIGFHDQKTFDLAQTIVVSPGIPREMIYLKTAAKKGVPIMGELDIFSRYNTSPIIAITGTNGKTTTTTLIRDMLNGSGISTFMGGNIGTPLVEYLMEGQGADMVVAEISSFQLDLAKNFKPEIALLLNVAEDHLDRYEGFEEYINSKWSIFKNQTSDDKAVVNRTIDGFETRISQISSQLFSFSSQPDSSSALDIASPDTKTDTKADARIYNDTITINTRDGLQNIPTRNLSKLVGIHNRENIAAAGLACLLAGGNLKGILQGLTDFKNLPHRMEFVRKLNGISFFNDSKATNTDAALRALDSFSENIILILGGLEKKGTDFSLLAPQITGQITGKVPLQNKNREKNPNRNKVKQIIAMGEASRHIQEVLEKFCPVFQVDSMENAVKSAYEMAGPGEVVLLSPACASFDMYENYGARGDDFILWVEGLKDEE